MIDDSETDINLALETALDAIDRGTIALHLIRNVSSAAERLERVRQAHDSFAAALAKLEEANARIKATEAWHEWFGEAQSSYQTTADRIIDLGE